MSAEAISEFAAELGIEDGQLIRFHRECVRKHGDKADEWLLAWMRKSWDEVRPRKWLLSRRSVPPYTESPSEAMGNEAEAVPPSEIAGYRKSREARDNYQAEQMDEVGNLMAAMREVRASLDALPAEKKRSMSRVIWTFKGRMDALEREVRRRIAA